MALSRALFLFALVAIFSTMAMAKEFVVGDENGWRLGVDYQSWAANKVFHVGDMLIFNYVAGNDNVVRVNGSDFKNCSAVPFEFPVLSSGNDILKFTTTGKRWYISGVANHCQLGQKLFLTVQPSQLALSPVPSSPSPSPIPATEAVASDAPWSPSPVPSPSASLSLSPSPTPAHEAAVSDAPWTAPRRSLLPKKLFKMIHRNLIGV